MSQRDQIIKHLKDFGSISPLEAGHVYGIARLASRVDELRQAGYRIVTHMKQDAKGRRYASYEFAPGGELLAFEFRS